VKERLCEREKRERERERMKEKEKDMLNMVALFFLKE
jgi:hypothetical protein